MPGFDRTGPAGAGPGTGWGRGLCNPQIGGARLNWGGFFGGIGRGGFPWGGGRGRCFGGRWAGWYRPFWSAQTPGPGNEAEALRAELAVAKEEMAAMEARLRELESTKSNEA